MGGGRAGGGTQKAEQALKKAELFEEAGIPAGLPISLLALSSGHSCLQVWLPLPVGCLHRSALGNLTLPQPFSSKLWHNREQSPAMPATPFPECL